LFAAAGRKQQFPISKPGFGENAVSFASMAWLDDGDAVGLFLAWIKCVPLANGIKSVRFLSWHFALFER
jgi:hypothetical protein